jgi:hypothetical protein
MATDPTVAEAPTPDAVRLSLARVASETPRPELPAFIAELAKAHAIALARLVAPEVPRPVALNPVEDPDAMLTHQEVAQALCEEERWVHRNWRKLPFAVIVSAKKIVFSRNGMHRWLATRTAKRR